MCVHVCVCLFVRVFVCVFVLSCLSGNGNVWRLPYFILQKTTFCHFFIDQKLYKLEASNCSQQLSQLQTDLLGGACSGNNFAINEL